MKIVSVVGARPEFIQVAMLSRALRERHDETLVHTGQHYDARMSERFFADLEIPTPDHNLAVGSLDPSGQVAEMVRGLADVLARTAPDLVIVRGDTNSTLAGAIAAKHLLLPLAHVEAGMRSYDRTMPEEINRVMTDHVADVHLVTDEAAGARLAREGITSGVHVCGDVMFDIFERVRERAHEALSPVLRDAIAQPFALITVHRAENTDDRERLASIVAGLANAPIRTIFPVHPRTAARLSHFGITLPENVVAIEPLGYREMVALECAARTILTDSGGVQREAYFAGVPCVTLRDTTEWTNTVEAGWNRLVGASTAAIAASLATPPRAPRERPRLFGDGNAAEHIVRAIESQRTMEVVRAAHLARSARGYAASDAATERAPDASGAVTR